MQNCNLLILHVSGKTGRIPVAQFVLSRPQKGGGGSNAAGVSLAPVVFGDPPSLPGTCLGEGVSPRATDTLYSWSFELPSSWAHLPVVGCDALGRVGDSPRVVLVIITFSLHTTR